MYIGICDACGRKALVRKSQKNRKFYCRHCSDRIRYYNKQGWEKCVFCGKVARVSLRKEESAVCPSCYRDRFRPKHNCDDCHEFRTVSTYEPNGKKLCSTCISRYRVADVSKFETCMICSRSKPVCSRNYESKPICYSCYNSGHRGVD